jgi:hypothetical protein
LPKNKLGRAVNAAFIQKRMKEKGLDVVTLAPRVGLVAGSLRNVCFGVPTHKAVLMLLAQELECKVEDLLMPTEESEQ